MPENLSLALCHTVVRDVARLAREKYVVPAVGEKLAASIEARLERGGYDDACEAGELALRLTEDLRALSNDKHWSILYDPHRLAARVDPETEEEDAKLARWLDETRRQNFGFEKVERLRGNIGYIDLREFIPSEHAGDTAVAAMGFVAHCDALIFDLRRNHGGYPSMVQLLTSYLLDPEPKHINTFYYRPSGETQQFWTFPHVPGKRLPDVPVYVLTSRATGSGAEEFAYNLKQMGRATLIGETTVGAAHPVTMEVVQEHFQVRLPYGRPINPISGENWEGTGVEPHISVPQEEALRTAHLHALAHLAETGHDDAHRRDLAWEAEIAASLYTPVHVEEATLNRYAGTYGRRSFAIEDGALTYMHQAQAIAWKLVPLTETRFRLDEDVKFEFIVDEEGIATAVHVFYRDDRPDIIDSKERT
ncbi:MAG: S41 family peptidase [Anaerolineae bacterium]|nr:S41 family peptidase [Anaerolineae bacterium]